MRFLVRELRSTCLRATKPMHYRWASELGSPCATTRVVCHKAENPHDATEILHAAVNTWCSGNKWRKCFLKNKWQWPRAGWGRRKKDFGSLNGQITHPALEERSFVMILSQGKVELYIAVFMHPGSWNTILSLWTLGRDGTLCLLSLHILRLKDFDEISGTDDWTGVGVEPALASKPCLVFLSNFSRSSNI